MPTPTSEREWREAAIRQVAIVVGPILCVTSFVMPRLAGLPSPLRVTIPELVFALGLMIGGLASRLRFEVRAMLVVGSGVALAELLSVVYGPTAGLGVAHFIPVLGASLLLGRRVAWGILALTSAMLIATGYALTHGLVPDAFPHVLTRPHEVTFGSMRGWLRIAITWAIAAGSLTIVVQAMITHVSASRDAAEQALRRAEREHAEREHAHREREVANEALLETERALAISQRLETVGRLAGGVAHDFNNALLVVLAWTDLLRRRTPSAEMLAQGLDAIERAATQAAQTSRQLLAVARRNVRAPRTVDLGALVRVAARSITRIFPADCVVETHVEPAAFVIADEGELQQMLLNLAINARDAMAHGGTIRIEVGFETASPRAERRVRLVVSDTGSGMDEATLARIFEPFFTTKGDSGTGLGLAMVRRTVKDAGGTIEVTSRVGEGTSFTLLFPAIADGAEDPAPRSFETQILVGVTILYVEDEESVRRAMVPALEHAGLEVLEARDGDEAIAIARRHRHPIDILCTDGIMPGMPTGQLIDQFRRLHPEASIVIGSGYLESDLLRKGVEEGQYAFIAKPYTGTELVARIHAELDRERRQRKQVV